MTRGRVQGSMLKGQAARGGQREGSALLVVLWATVVLSFAVAMAAERVALILSDAGIRSRRLQAEMLADTALVSLTTILKEEKQSAVNPGNEKESSKRRLNLERFVGTWCSEPVALGDGFYRIEITDEQARINWLKTPTFAWRSLLQLADMPAQQVDAWLDALEDWQDTDDGRRLNGAETMDYQSLPDRRRKAKNAAVTEMGELRWIFGEEKILAVKVPGELPGTWRALWPMTTIHGDGKININTAPAPLIAAAAGISLEDAQRLVKDRQGPDGIPDTVDDLYQAIPAWLNPQGRGGTSTSALTSKAELFRIRGIGIYQRQQVVREAMAVLKAETGLRLVEAPYTVEARTLRKEEEQPQ
ncbi:MAG: type II secretion system protein GspK [Verrucomicrobiae bacterium]|nr:type II secretion system protein GspK [Verrucomicrobiae bacterium]